MPDYHLETSAEGHWEMRKIHEEPHGYPKLATFLDCDENFMIYRRFGYLQARLLLQKQDELAELEDRLAVEEQKYRNIDPQRLRNRRVPNDILGDTHKELLTTIETKWNEYCHLVTNASKLVSLRKPISTHHRSVMTWMNNVKPVVPDQSRFILHREDLITLKPLQQHTWTEAVLEWILSSDMFTPLRHWLRTQDTISKTDGKDGLRLYSRSRIDSLAYCAKAVAACILLLAVCIHFGRQVVPAIDLSQVFEWVQAITILGLFSVFSYAVYKALNQFDIEEMLT